MKRLVVVAEDSLIVQAVAIGLRRSGEFKLLSAIDGRSASGRTTFSAAGALVSGCSRESSPCRMKIEASMGRATGRRRAMPGRLPRAIGF